MSTTIGEVEDRVCTRLQGKRSTICTREGIPHDDALDILTAKIKSYTENQSTQSDEIIKIQSDIDNKVDRKSLTLLLETLEDL